MEDATETNFEYVGSALKGRTDGGKPGISEVKDGTPSYQKCADPTRNYEFGVDVENYNTNSMFCVRTLLGRYAAMRMTKDWQSPEYIDLTIVSWEPRS